MIFMKKRKLLLLALAAVFATSVFSGCGTDSATNKNEMVIKATFGNEPETLDQEKRPAFLKQPILVNYLKD